MHKTNNAGCLDRRLKAVSEPPIRMVNIYVLTAVLLCCCTTQLPAQDYPLEYPCYYLEKAPQLDGNLDEATWQAVPESSGFFILATDKRAVAKATVFKAGWSQDALYIAVKCREESPAKMRAERADEGEIWSDDSVEMLFQRPVTSELYRQLVVNSKGARCNLMGGTPGRNWNWEVKTAVGTADWSVEAKIPFAVFGGAAPQENECWLVNVARNASTGSPEEHWTCWPPLKGAFAEIKNFGRFVFKREPPGPDVYRRFLADAIRKETEPLREDRQVILKGLANPRLKPDAERLNDLLTRSEDLLTKPDAKIADMERFVDQNRKLRARVGELRSILQMESLFE